jgi:hypothetical protein
MFYAEILKGENHLGERGVDGRTILKESSLGVWIGFIWLRIGTSGRLV